MTTENNKENIEKEKTPIPCSLCGRTGNIVRYNEKTKFAVCDDCMAHLSNQGGNGVTPHPVHPQRVVDKAPGRGNPYNR